MPWNTPVGSVGSDRVHAPCIPPYVNPNVNDNEGEMSRSLGKNAICHAAISNAI